jgi:hypothetical protein
MSREGSHRNAVLLALILLCLPLILAWVAVYLLFTLLSGAVLRIWFWRAHASQGRFILFVYSESPNWQSYVEVNILPRIRDSAVVLNWSQRRDWSSQCPWEARFFRRFSGDREFNPLALVFGRRGRITKIRFHQAFLDHKHGRTALLEQAEARLYEVASAAG